MTNEPKKIPKSYKLHTVLTEADRSLLLSVFVLARNELLRRHMVTDAESVRRLGQTIDDEIELRNVEDGIYD